MKFRLLIILSFFSLQLTAQTFTNVYPTHWWTGMKNPKLQLMIHSTGIKSAVSSVSLSYPGVSLTKTTKLESDNYLFLDLNIAASAKPGTIKINCKRAGAPRDQL
jgi:hypothetical protein